MVFWILEKQAPSVLMTAVMHLIRQSIARLSGLVATPFFQSEDIF